MGFPARATSSKWPIYEHPQNAAEVLSVDAILPRLRTLCTMAVQVSERDAVGRSSLDCASILRCSTRPIHNALTKCPES